MRLNLFFVPILLFSFLINVNATPRGDFMDYILKSETDAKFKYEGKDLAIIQDKPLEILFPGENIVKAEVIGVEDGKVVYAIYKNLLHPYNDGELMFFEDIQASFDLSTAKIVYYRYTIDNSNGFFEPVINPNRTSQKLFLIPEWNQDKVFALDALTGDIYDTAFIPNSAPNLASPKEARLTNRGTILVSDQIVDVVQEFDTNGNYIRIFAPDGVVNNNILDNLRGIEFERYTNNLFVTSATGPSANTIQKFDTSGSFMGTFIGAGTSTSPFDLIYWKNRILVSSSSGANKLALYDTLGTFQNYAPYTSNFFQQVMLLGGDSVAVSSFSGVGVAGLALLDTNLNLSVLLNVVTGNRGVGRLPNGNYIITNAGGIHEITPNNTLVRTIIATGSYQYVSLYDPDMLVSTGNNYISTIPDEFKLHANYPNPFNPTTVIKFEIPVDEYVSLKIFDASGKELYTLVNGFRQAGTYEILFNGIGLSSGVYFYRIEAGNFAQTNRMVLIK